MEDNHFQIEAECPSPVCSLPLWLHRATVEQNLGPGKDDHRRNSSEVAEVGEEGHLRGFVKKIGTVRELDREEYAAKMHLEIEQEFHRQDRSREQPTEKLSRTRKRSIFLISALPGQESE